MSDGTTDQDGPGSFLQDADSSDDNRTHSASGASMKRHDQSAQRRPSHPSGAMSDTSHITGRTANVPAKQHEAYNEPNDFANLNENEATSPIQNVAEDSTYRRESYLEDASEDGTRKQPQGRSSTGEPSVARRSHAGTENSLSENLAPAPIENREEGPKSKETFLEDGDRTPTDSSVSPSPPDQDRSKSSGQAVQQSSTGTVSRAATELYTISYLVFFSFLGTLARLGLQWLTSYPGAPVVTPVLWANFGGSLFMGFLAEDRQLFRDEWDEVSSEEERRKKQHEMEKDPEAFAKKHAKTKKTIPLYIGLATGFCGSFTSFSSFQRDVFLALSNDLPTPVNHPYPGVGSISSDSTVHRDGGYSFMALVGIIILTLALCLSALKVGAHIALLLQPLTPTIPFRLARKVLDRGVVFLAFGCWIGAVFLAIWPPDRPSGPASRGPWSNETWRGEVIFALVFAPLGCLLRFYASMKMNGLVAAFPLGTFAVNMLGTAIEGMCYDLQHVSSGAAGIAGGGRVGCQVLQGVMDGFCGCLTTVSTWVAELEGLRRRHAYTYGTGSVVGGMCLMIVIMGSVRWSIGWIDPVCNTGTHTFPT